MKGARVCWERRGFTGNARFQSKGEDSMKDARVCWWRRGFAGRCEGQIKGARILMSECRGLLYDGRCEGLMKRWGFAGRSEGYDGSCKGFEEKLRI